MDCGTAARPVGYILRDLPIENAGTPEQKTGAGIIGPEPLAVPCQVSCLGPEGILGVVPLLVPHLQSVFPVLKRSGERRLLSGRSRMVERVQTGPLVLRHLQGGLHRFQRQPQLLRTGGLHAPPQHLRGVIVPLCFPVGLRQQQVPLRRLRRLLQGPLQIVNGRRPVSLFRLFESLLPQVSRLVLPIRGLLVRDLRQFLRMEHFRGGHRRRRPQDTVQRQPQYAGRQNRDQNIETPYKRSHWPSSPCADTIMLISLSFILDIGDGLFLEIPILHLNHIPGLVIGIGCPGLFLSICMVSDILCRFSFRVIGPN